MTALHQNLTVTESLGLDDLARMLVRHATDARVYEGYAARFGDGAGDSFAQLAEQADSARFGVIEQIRAILQAQMPSVDVMDVIGEIS